MDSYPALLCCDKLRYELFSRLVHMRGEMRGEMRREEKMRQIIESRKDPE